jgi:uncharacterized protein YkwD
MDRRRGALVAAAAAVVVLLVPTAGSADPRGSLSPASAVQASLLAQVNALRARHGLSRLRQSSALGAAANGHSVQMARVGYFSHSSANGASFSGRIARYYPARGYRAWAVGENLLWGSPAIGAARALRLWLASAAHRANLLSPRWREVGLAAIHSTSAPGVYGGSPVTIVTADFGARSR